MQPLIQVGDRPIDASDILPLLREYGLLPHLIRECFLDAAIADVVLTPEEEAAAEKTFCDRQRLGTAEEKQAWIQQRYGTPELLALNARRDARLQKFKQEMFDNEVQSYFLQRKGRLDRVLYSLIRTREAGLAQELYFRIQDDGHSFADLAREHSEGQEAGTGGLIGPVELSVPHPQLANQLAISQPGQLWPPRKIGEWFILVRLEKFLPAQMDDAMRQRLIEELFQQWLQQQMQALKVEFPAPELSPLPSSLASGADSGSHAPQGDLWA